MSFLKVSGTHFVNGSTGKPVVLLGAGLGGWMMMENFISGFAGCEFQIREALADSIGVEKASFFFEKYLENFFAEPDARFFKSLGLNCIRIAINYRHFEDDLNPRVLKPEGFKHLDRVISLCAAQSIYTIIDMHTAPGGQSGGWHADAGTHLGNFWRHKDFQNRFVWLWTKIAEHYKDNVWIAGYNILNEPADPHPTHARLISLYDQTCASILSVDPNHILFLDGNTFATDFTQFPSDSSTRWGSNVAFAIHDYSVFGFPKSPEPYEGSVDQRERMRQSYERKRKWTDQRGLCVWNGEWGPVYGRGEYDGDKTEDINQRRYMVLKDQLGIYRKDSLSWSIWLYKDIGYQGMVSVAPETPYIKHFDAFLQQKHRLAVDAWGADDASVKHVYKPIVDLVNKEIPDHFKKLYPPIWSPEERVTRISRTILLAEFLVREWAELFKGLSEEELEALAGSFAFENCVRRQELNEILKENASMSVERFEDRAM